MTNLKKFKKNIFGVKFGVRLKFKHKNGFKTINTIHPENLGLLDPFLSEIEQYKKAPPLFPKLLNFGSS